MIFESGYKRVDYEAAKNPATTEDDLYTPGWTDLLSAAFDSAYYRAGSGVANELSVKFNERNNKLADLMREKGFPEDAIQSIYLNRTDNIPEGMSKEDYAATNPHYKPELYNEVMSMFRGQVADDEDIISEVRSNIKGQLSQADRVLEKGDSLTALFAGAIGGVFTDPAVIATSFIPMFNAEKLPRTMMTVGNILKQSSKIGAGAAAGEVFSIPLQKQNAAFLGEKYGIWEAATNIALAGAGGSILGAVGLSGLKAKDFVKNIAKGVDNAPNAPLEAADIARTLSKAEKEGLIKNPEDIESLVSNQDEALKGVSDWTKEYDFDAGEFSQGRVFDEIVHPEKVGAKQAASATLIESGIYDDILTKEDAIRDAELFKKAEQLDVKIQQGIEQDADGEITQVLRSYKEVAEEINKEIDGIEAVMLCMRGGK